MGRTRFVIQWVMLLAAFIGVSMLKHEVTDLQGHVKGLKAQLAAEQDAMHVLTVEWAYLNNPDRLQQLVDKHLQRAPVAGSQFVEISALPMADTSRAFAAAALPQGVPVAALAAGGSF